MLIWVFAALVVFLISLVVAVVSVERDFQSETEELAEDRPDKGDADFLPKLSESIAVGHGRSVGELPAESPVELLDDTTHTHDRITQVTEAAKNEVNTQPESVAAKEEEGGVLPTRDDDEDEIIPRYLEEAEIDKEKTGSGGGSSKLMGEIEL